MCRVVPPRHQGKGTGPRQKWARLQCNWSMQSLSFKMQTERVWIESAGTDPACCPCWAGGAAARWLHLCLRLPTTSLPNLDTNEGRKWLVNGTEVPEICWEVDRR